MSLLKKAVCSGALLLLPGPCVAALLGVTCSMATTPLNFGNYDAFSQTDQTVVGSINVSCTTLIGLSSMVSLKIGVSSGNSGLFSTRELKQGASSLQYNLYTSPSYATILGNGAGGSQALSDSFTLQFVGSTRRSYPVYGQIPRSQNVRPGNYTDTLIITIDY